MIENSPTCQNSSGSFSLSRLIMKVGTLGLCCVMAATACIQSRYMNTVPGSQDGATGAENDAAGLDGALFDAARTDSARGGGSDGGGSDGGAAVIDAGRDASAPSDDPFDPGSCSGPAVSSAQALALLGAASRVVLGDATLYRRTRTCPTPATCGAWGTPVVHQQDLLTYSGGVTTAYKTFSFPTHLLVYSQAGPPKFVIRHESDYRHDATADSRGVGFALGTDPMENTSPVIYVWDFAPAPDRYEDLAGRLGDKGQLHVAAHCARIVFPIGMTGEIAALYRY